MDAIISEKGCATSSQDEQRVAKIEQKGLRKTYGLDVVRPHHREIARRLTMGQSPSRIAKEMGVTATRINQLINTPMFKLELNRLMEMRDQVVTDVIKEFKEISPVAVAVLERVMLTAKSERLRKEAAESLLDRAGFGAINKSAIAIKSEIVHKGYGNMTDAELRNLVKNRIMAIEGEEACKMEEAAEAELIEVDVKALEDDCSTVEQAAELARLFMGED